MNQQLNLNQQISQLVNLTAQLLTFAFFGWILFALSRIVVRELKPVYAQAGWVPVEKRIPLEEKYGSWAVSRAEAMVPPAAGVEMVEAAAKHMWELYRTRYLVPPPPPVPPPAPPVVKTVLKLTSDPEGMPFGVSGPTSFSGETPEEREVKPGKYIVTWKEVKGFEKPAPEELTIEEGQTITVHGVYKPIARGVVKVTSEPEKMSFTIKGPPGTITGETPWELPDTPPGIYEIAWRRVTGYTRPKTEKKELEPGGTLEFHGVYTPVKPKVITLEELEKTRPEKAIELRTQLTTDMVKLLKEHPAMRAEPDEKLAKSIIAWAEEKGVIISTEEAVEIVKVAREELK